ncbi:MAG TPA: hypothetical protein VGB24_04515 [Longimicrobium sp.]|jgi:hypothetical protein|uniref:hypothetical protein n=1 Tax=Longimicrobium sp. TaxID=2029185 RepID=UPI002EDB66AE
MTVVINELEVVVSEPQGSSQQPAPAGPPALGPREIAELLERRARQELRLFAH